MVLEVSEEYQSQIHWLLEDWSWHNHCRVRVKCFLHK